MESVSESELHAALNAVRLDVLASHLVIMEELRAIREEVFTPDQEARRFFESRRAAAEIRRRHEELGNAALSRVLARHRRPGPSDPES